MESRGIHGIHRRFRSNCSSSRSEAKKTAIDYIPKADDIDLDGLEEEVSAEDMRELLYMDVAGWKIEMESIKELYSRFGDKLPHELTNQLRALKKRLNNFG